MPVGRWQEAAGEQERRMGYDLQQRSAAGIEPRMLRSCEMCHNQDDTTACRYIILEWFVSCTHRGFCKEPHLKCWYPCVKTPHILWQSWTDQDFISVDEFMYSWFCSNRCFGDKIKTFKKKITLFLMITWKCFIYWLFPFANFNAPRWPGEHKYLYNVNSIMLSDYTWLQSKQL